MRKIKALVAILLAIAFCVALAACGGSNNDQPANTGGGDQPASTGGGSQPADTGGGGGGGGAPATQPAGTGIQEGTQVSEGGLTVAGVASPGTVDGTIGYGQKIEPLPGTQFADVVNISIEVAVSMLDPQSSGGTSSANRLLSQTVYDRLTYFNEFQEVVPELATSWETNDAQTWVFHLRNDVTFHNGDKFTAQDVINTYKRALNDPASLAWNQWLEVDSVTALDDYTVEIVTKSPYASFAYNLTQPGGAIINQRAIDADPVKGAWIGTGPFYISDFVSGATVECTRYDNYWGTKALTKQMNWVYVPEIAARTVMQMNGEMDVTLSVSSEDNEMFVADPGYIVYSYAANTTHSLTFSMIHPITGDKNFRLAVAHAINREEAAIASSGRWAKPTQDGTFWGDSTPFRNTSIPRIEQDLDKAKQYLADSTYNGEQLEILTAPDTLTVSSQMLQEQLRAIGINCTVRTADVPSLVANSNYGDKNMTLLHFVSPFELDPSAAKVVLYPEYGGNRATYVNQEVIDLLDKVVGVTDPNEQRDIYYKIQEIVAEDLPQISIFEKIWTIVTNDRVGGIIINPDMNHDLRGVFMIAE